MKRLSLFSCLAAAVVVLSAACESANTQTAKPAADSASAMKPTPVGFDYKLVQNRKDPACGMPVTAGISDTAHYKEYALGFCSKECKDAFQKSPETLLAAADIAK